MDHLFIILFPLILLTSRVGAFLSVVPIYGSASVPTVLRAGLAIWLSLFFAMLAPPAAFASSMHWMKAVMLVAQEALIGLAIGLAARMVFLAIHQGGVLIGQTMGLSDAETIDPMSGEASDSLGQFLETALTLAFLSVGGHQLLILLLGRSLQVMPLAGLPEAGSLARGIVAAGTMMLMLGLKLAAPMIAAFMLLAVVLAILARVLPEMNILFESYPLRIGLGFFMTAAMFSTMNNVVLELSGWMSKMLA